MAVKRHRSVFPPLPVFSDIVLPIHVLDGQATKELIITAFAHILFMREQIPEPVTGLRNTIEPLISKGRGNSMYIRKLQKFISCFDAIELAVNSVCSSGPIDEVVLMIGATVTSPREIYVLHLPSDCWCHSADISARARNECCRRVVRDMVGMWTEVYSNHCPPVTTNSYIAISPSSKNGGSGNR